MNEMIGDGFSFLQNENYIKSDGANWDTKWESIFTASTESYGWLIVNAKGDKAYKVYDLDSKVEEVVKW
jgi:hypothetical protein